MELPEKLPDNTVALVRLPISIQRMTALCELYREPAHHVSQQGDWIVVTKEEGGRP